MPFAERIAPQNLSEGELAQVLLAAQEDFTLLCAPDTTILYASPSIKKMLGYEPDEVVGGSFAEFVHPDDLQALAEEWERYQNGVEDDPIQYRTRRKDGSWGWFEARASHITDRRLVGCSCINVRAVEHHYQLRNRIATAEAMAKIGSWRWITKDGEPEWTASMYRILGYEPVEGALDLEWAYNLIHPDEREDFRDYILGSLEAPQPFTTVKRMMAATGEYRSIVHHCHSEQNASGEIVAMIGICQDVTAQAEAERALRESERLYRVLADEASDVIFKVSTKGICIYASPACTHTLGFRPDEMVGTPILRYALRSDHHIIRAAYERAAQGLQAQRVTFRGVHRLGETVWLEASVRPVIDATGNFTELVIVARDITERRQYEEELRRAREKAEAANITKSKFLANMSHELRTPLNAVIGFSDIMREEMFGPMGSDQYTDYIQLIHESGQFLLDLINDILDMSKIEAGKYDLYIENIGLEDMVAGCLRIMEGRIGSDSIALNWSVPEDLPPIPADERAVKQILLNLLSNAVKFTDAGGAIAVIAEGLDDCVRISVTDTGCGIPPEAIPRLAQPFEQAMSDSTAGQGGTGLGLALVKSFVELHDGALTIESIEGEGTTVAFTLPFEAAAQKKSA